MDSDTFENGDLVDDWLGRAWGGFGDDGCWWDGTDGGCDGGAGGGGW